MFNIYCPARKTIRKLSTLNAIVPKNSIVILELFETHLRASGGSLDVFDQLVLVKDLQDLDSILPRDCQMFKMVTGLEETIGPVNSVRCRETVRVGAKVAPVAFERHVGAE